MQCCLVNMAGTR